MLVTDHQCTAELPALLSKEMHKPFSRWEPHHLAEDQTPQMQNVGDPQAQSDLSGVSSHLLGLCGDTRPWLLLHRLVLGHSPFDIFDMMHLSYMGNLPPLGFSKYVIITKNPFPNVTFVGEFQGLIRRLGAQNRVPDLFMGSQLAQQPQQSIAIDEIPVLPQGDISPSHTPTSSGSSSGLMCLGC